MPPPFALLEVADSTMRLRNDFGAGLFCAMRLRFIPKPDTQALRG